MTTAIAPDAISALSQRKSHFVALHVIPSHQQVATTDQTISFMLNTAAGMADKLPDLRIVKDNLKKAIPYVDSCREVVETLAAVAKIAGTARNFLVQNSGKKPAEKDAIQKCIERTEQVIGGIHRISSELAGRFEFSPIIGALGVTGREVLDLLSSGPKNQGTLSAATEVSPPAMTLCIDRLENLVLLPEHAPIKLVERRRDHPCKKTVVNVYITDEGRMIASQIRFKAVLNNLIQDTEI